MKNQALLYSKDKSKKFKCCLLQFLFGALRVKRPQFPFIKRGLSDTTCCMLSVRPNEIE